MNSLNWQGDFAFYPVKQTNKYNKLYFDKYIQYSKTELGKKILQFRLDFVNKYTHGEVCDIGIGCGTFVEARSELYDTVGFDVNPSGISWLTERNLLIDYRNEKVSSATCFDSLEHVEFPSQLLKQIRSHIFISIPIFKDKEHVLKSKHFRTDEHYWYFTENGLIKYMTSNGFYLLEVTDYESTLGREDILTFAFKRIQ